MADFYTSIGKTANKLVNKFGKQITIQRKISGTFDPVTGKTSGDQLDIQNIKAVVLPASGGKIAALDLRYNLSSLTYKRLNYCNISGADLEWIPTLNDNIIISGDKWTIIGITPLNPNNGIPLLYEVAFTI